MDALRLFGALWFLPLFPFSGLFIQLVGRRPLPAWLRASLFLAWPLIGVLFLGPEVPDWIRAWALASALLYALRLLSTRDLRLWLAYLAASAYALLWLPDFGHSPGWPTALSLGVAPALLALFALALEKRFGAAYAGVSGGLQLRQPQLARLFTLLILAAVATPVFPAFFALTGMALHSAPAWSSGMLVTWVLWSWSAFVLLQRFMLAPSQHPSSPDLCRSELIAYGAVLAACVAAGFILIPQLLSGA